MSCRAIACSAPCEAILHGILSGIQQFLQNLLAAIMDNLRLDLEKFREMLLLFQRREKCYHELQLEDLAL